MRRFIGDRIQINSVLIVGCFVAVLLLESQSAASYPSYFLAVAMLVSFGQWNDVFRLRLTWFLFAFLVYLSLSSFWSTPFEWRPTRSVFVRTLLMLLFVVAYAECQLRGQVRRWLPRAMAIVGILATVAAIVNFLATSPVDGRLNGLGQLDTHVIAALVYGVALIFVLDVLMRESSAVWRSIAILSVVTIGCAVFLSDSRNAWVSVLIGAIVFLLAHIVEDRQRFVASIVATAFTGTVILAVLIANESSRDLVLPRGLSFRPSIWAHELDRILAEGPWIGLGITTKDDLQLGGMTFLHPHNMYLSVLFQGGIVGLAGFLVLTGWTVAVLLQFYRQEEAKLALGVLGIALPAYLLDGHELIDKVGPTWFLYWLPVATALGFAWRRRTQGR